MKNQYFGDINDYRKYGLMRVLAGRSRLTLGICWLLTEDDEHGDGELRAYLSKPSRWRHYDPELYESLQRLVTSDVRRDVRLAREWTLIPNAMYFETVVQDNLARRDAYFDAAWEALRSCDLVFFDPDNGIEIESIPRGRAGSAQYVYWRELQEAYRRGQSLLIYQHFPRVNRERFVPFIANRLAEEIGSSHVAGFQTPYMAFLLVQQARHVSALAGAVSELEARWSGQIKVWRPNGSGDPTSR
jgi:hypothetical protein